MEISETIESGKTLIENNGGDVTVHGETEDDNVNLQIPSNYSALAVLGHNDAYAGDVFAADFWVYRNGVKHRKWFLSRHGIDRLWPPQLDRLEHLELVYRKLHTKQMAYYAKSNAFVTNEIFDGKASKDAEEKKVILYAEPTHDYTDKGTDKYRWWKYTVKTPGWSGEHDWSYHFDWIDKLPANVSKEALELGQKLYAIEYTEARRMRRRFSTAFCYLDEAIKNKICKNCSLDMRKKYRVTLNGRDYWYSMQGDRWPELKPLMFPEDVNVVSV